MKFTYKKASAHNRTVGSWTLERDGNVTVYNEDGLEPFNNLEDASKKEYPGVKIIVFNKP